MQTNYSLIYTFNFIILKTYVYIPYSRFFEGENFHELNTIREIFTLEIFTIQRAFIKMALFKYFKVDERVKEDNSDVVLPSSSGSLAETIPSSRTDAVNSSQASGGSHHGQREGNKGHL